MTGVEQKNDEVKIIMYENAKVQPEKIPVLIQSYGDALVFKPENPPYFLYRKKGKNKKEKDADTMELVKKLLNDIKGLLE